MNKEYIIGGLVILAIVASYFIILDKKYKDADLDSIKIGNTIGLTSEEEDLYTERIILKNKYKAKNRVYTDDVKGVSINLGRYGYSEAGAPDVIYFGEWSFYNYDAYTLETFQKYRMEIKEHKSKEEVINDVKKEEFDVVTDGLKLISDNDELMAKYGLNKLNDNVVVWFWWGAMPTSDIYFEVIGKNANYMISGTSSLHELSYENDFIVEVLNNIK